MEWLVCFWLWCECGVQPDHTSLNHRAFRQVFVCDLYPCLLKHVRVKTEAVLLIMLELIPQRSKLTCVCWFVLQTSPSVCNHSSPASIREVIPKCLSPENNRQYKTPVATERVRTQSTMREDQISLDAHADPADRVVCVHESKQHPIYPNTSTVCLLVCTGAADKQPGNEFLPGKAECEAKMSTKTKV